MSSTELGTPRAERLGAALRATLKVISLEADSYARRKLATSFGLLAISSVLAALIPVAYKMIVDSFGEKGDPQSLTPMLLIAAYLVCQYAVNASDVLRQFVHGQGTQRLNRGVSNRLFNHIVRLPLRFHLDRKTGAVGETLNQGLNGCQVLLQHVVFTFLPVVVEFAAIVVVLIHLDLSRYLVVIGVSSLAYGYTFWRAAESVSAPSRAVSTSHVEAHSTLCDTLLNYETVKYFHGEELVAARYDKTLRDKEQAWWSLLRIRFQNGLALETIFAISFSVTLCLAGYEVTHGVVTIGDFVLINTYVGQLYRPLEAVGYAARDISQGLGFVQRMLDILGERTEQQSTIREEDGGEWRGTVEFQGVSFGYRPDRRILHDVSFRVSAGRTLGVVGVSGSGKSSLIRLLFRLYEPSEGRILIDGAPIAQLPLRALRQLIAVVPQDTVLFNDTLANNLAFGRPNCTREEIEEAAALAHLGDFIHSLPEGYATQVGERGLKLSGGEKQRVAIARAALKRPMIYVFDEATSSLDSASEKGILENLIEVSHRSTTIVIAHRLSAVVHADEILVFEKGVIVERGRHADLLSKNGNYAALWKAQNSSRDEAA